MDNAVIDGARLAYHHSPGTTGETVVLLHGTPSHTFLWRNVIPEPEADGHGVLAHDLLGYGRSERPVGRATSVVEQVPLLHGLLDHLGIERCTLVAHDIGGAIAQLFAVEHPQRVRRLMLIDSVCRDSWPSPTWRRIIEEHGDDHARLPQQDFEQILTRQLQSAVATPMAEPVLDAYLEPHRGPLGRLSFFEHQVRHYDSRPTREIAARLPELTMPTRVLWGEQDRWQPVELGEWLARTIPGAELAVIPAAGHFLPEEAPGRVAAEIRSLLGES